jgi:hypothetical protein
MADADDLGALKHHGLVTFCVLLVELVLKGLVKLGVYFNLVPRGFGDILQGIMSLFLVFAIVIFTVTTIVLLVRNAWHVVLGGTQVPPASPGPSEKAPPAATGSATTEDTPSAGSGGPKRGDAA